MDVPAIQRAFETPALYSRKAALSKRSPIDIVEKKLYFTELEYSFFTSSGYLTILYKKISPIVKNAPTVTARKNLGKDCEAPSKPAIFSSAIVSPPRPSIIEKNDTEKCLILFCVSIGISLPYIIFKNIIPPSGSGVKEGFLQFDRFSWLSAASAIVISHNYPLHPSPCTLHRPPF